MPRVELCEPEHQRCVGGDVPELVAVLDPDFDRLWRKR